MPVSINVGSNRRESTLDKILKGLSLASQGVSIASGIQDFRTKGTQKDLYQAQLEAQQMENQGIVTPASAAKLGLVRSPVVAAAPKPFEGANGPIAPPPPQRFSRLPEREFKTKDTEGNITSQKYIKSDDLEKLEESETKLRKEYQDHDLTKQTTQVLSFADKAIKGVSSKNGIGDVTAITSFSRLLDPETGVKDQEFNNVARSSGVLATLQNMMPYLQKGTRIPDELRNAFIAQVELLRGAQLERQGLVDEEFKDIAKDRGFDKLEGRIGNWGKVSSSVKKTAREPSDNRPDVVIQNGHEYRLNRKTGKYE